MGHEFFTDEEVKSWQSWMDSPASPPLSPSGVKKFTPDYENLDRDKAIEDFRERIKHYEDSYEPLSIEKEGLVGFTVISSHLLYLAIKSSYCAFWPKDVSFAVQLIMDTFLKCTASSL